MAILGAGALASALLLGGCGGGSSSDASAPASAEAVSSESVSAEPPRPSGISDDDWAAMVTKIGNADTMLAQAQAKTPDELAAACQQPTPTDEELQSGAEQSATEYPGSTAEEWMAVFDWQRAQVQIVLDQVCVDVPAEDAG